MAVLCMLFFVFSFKTTSGQVGAPCFSDQTTADFNLGSPDANTSVADGSVGLKAGLSEDFSATSIPSGWTSENFDASGSTLFAGGEATVNGTHIFTSGSFGPGSVLEFVATFNAGSFQNIGFSLDGPFNAPWVTVGQGSQDGNVYARYSGGNAVNLGPLLGSAHLYRIEWNASDFNIIVDNGVSASVTLPFTVGANMVVQISDLLTGDGMLSVDWIRLTPYATPGTFTSRVYDAGTAKTWMAVNWSGDFPAGTSLDMAVRTGNTPTPDASWTSFTTLAASGDAVNQTSRYIQYRATLATSSPHISPLLHEVSINCMDASPVVTLDPVDAAVCNGANASFTSDATGATGVQWQVNTGNGTWTDIAGAMNATLSFNATQADDGRQYRAVWSGAGGSTNSAAATLTVKPLTSLTSALSATVNSGTLFSYVPTGSVAGTSFNWSRAIVAGIDNPAASGSGAINETLVNSSSSPIVVIYVYSMLADGCERQQNVEVTVNPVSSDCITTTSISQHFNNYTISSGRYIWFNSVFSVKDLGNGPANLYVTNSRITYKLNNVTYTIPVPDAHVYFSGSNWFAETDYTTDGWETRVRSNYSGNIFLTGLSYLLPHNLPKKLKNVTWTMDIRIDRPNAKIKWKWEAGVYSRFAANGGLNVKPTDGLLSFLSPFINIGNAGTPMNYFYYIMPGGTTTGLFNHGNTYSSVAPINCGDITSNAIVSAPELMEEPGLPGMGELAVKAYPNPSGGTFNLAITGGDGSAVGVRVLDVNGRLIEQHNRVSPGTILVMGERWRAGIYLVEVRGTEQRKLVKLVKAGQ